MNIDLSGKVAIVTGAASGIGKGIAAGLAKSKSDVAIADINIDGANETAEELAKEYGVRAVGVKRM